MRQLLGGGRRASGLGCLVAGLAALGAFAPNAGAVLVHVGHGQIAGVLPIRGVRPASIPGSFAKRRARASRARAKRTADTGQLSYHNGPVLHASAPYLIFWDPSNQISAADKALYERFFADSAADSGRASNVYAVNRQFTDATGFADYQQVFSAAQSITDTQPYPATGQCTANFGQSACLFDAQLQAEVSRLIATSGLPTGVTGNAPVYFVVTPPDVNTCFADGTTCADNTFCAYHSSYTDLSTNSTVLYSDIPTVLALNAPKNCQVDNTASVQSPNGNPVTDVALKYTSHEYNEVITDPVSGTGWNSTASGQENGDECNFAGAFDPAAGSNPNAYLPALGGSAAAGTLYDQVMNANPYYVQSEWSNGDGTCKMQPTASALTAAVAAPSTAALGTAVSLDPTASASAGGYTSTTWDFGDGTGSFTPAGPAVASHAYSAIGTYTIRLTLVDSYGNLSTASQALTVHGPEVAAFSAPARASAGSGVSFDGTGSSDPGASISSYSWNFGDGSAPGGGATTSHAYATAGTYTVTLTITDNVGATAATSHQVTVVGIPSAGLSNGRAIAGDRVSFDARASRDIGSSIVSYSWGFGDGASATGATPGHTFAKIGSYTVTLTVADASGQSASASSPVTVKAPSIGRVRVKKGRDVEILRITLTGPGTLRVGKRKFHVARARTVRVRVKITPAQRGRLRQHHKLIVKVKLKFTPISGQTSKKVVRIRLKG